MKTHEAAILQPHEPNIVDEALRQRPVLLVGEQAILGFLANQAIDPAQEMKAGEASPKTETPFGYAWTRLAVWLIDRDTYREVESDAIVRCTNCSSLPYEAVLALAEEFHRRGRKAHEVVRSLLSEQSMHALKSSEETFQLLPLAMALTKHSTGKNTERGQQSTLARELLVSAIHRTLYEITPDEFKDIEKLKSQLRSSMLFQRYVYTQDLQAGDIESSWGVRYEHENAGLTYRAALRSLKIPTMAAQQARQGLRHDPENKTLREMARQTVKAGSILAGRFLDWQVGRVAEMIFGDPQLRPFRSISMDIADPDDILKGSLAHLPPALYGSNIVPHAVASLLNKRQHIQRDAYEPIPAPAESLALNTNIDGMPYHSPPARTESEVQQFKMQNLSMLLDSYTKLAPGGLHVIFPWDVAEGAPEQLQALDEIIYDFTRFTGQSIDRRVFDLNTLRDWMSDADKHIAEELSPIFRSGRDRFESLIIRKPKTSTHSPDYGRDFHHMSMTPSFLEFAPDWPSPAGTEDVAFEQTAFKRAAVDTLFHLYENAEFGREVTFRPWGIGNGHPERVRLINEIAVELAGRVHHGIDVRIYHKTCLRNPIGDDEYFVAVAFTKPRESLVKVHKRALAKARKQQHVY